MTGCETVDLQKRFFSAWKSVSAARVSDTGESERTRDKNRTSRASVRPSVKIFTKYKRHSNLKLQHKQNNRERKRHKIHDRHNLGLPSLNPCTYIVAAVFTKSPFLQVGASFSEIKKAASTPTANFKKIALKLQARMSTNIFVQSGAKRLSFCTDNAWLIRIGPTGPVAEFSSRMSSSGSKHLFRHVGENTSDLYSAEKRIDRAIA